MLVAGYKDSVFPQGMNSNSPPRREKARNCAKYPLTELQWKDMGFLQTHCSLADGYRKYSIRQ